MNVAQEDILNNTENQRPSEDNAAETTGTKERRKARTSGRPRRKKGRKRKIHGELADPVQFRELSSDSSSNESEHVEVIDVEKIKDLPLVDLTKDSKNDIYVDLTKELPKSPEGTTTSLTASVICISPSTQSQPSTHQLPEKSKDDIVLVNSPIKRTENSPEQQITCAICMDSLSQIKRGRRRLTSTTCGHVFCNICIESALNSQAKCPTCRQKLTRRQLHPIFI